MRILVLHSRYRSGPASGENRVVEDEVRLLRQGGHAVAVWSPSVDPGSAAQLIRTAKDTVWSSSAVAEVKRLLDTHHPEIVHVHNLFPALSPAVLRVAASRSVVVMTLHNYRLMCLPGTFLRDGRVCEACLGRVPLPGVRFGCYQGSIPASTVLAASISLHKAIGSFGEVTRFFAVSEFLREKHVAAGIDPRRIVVKPNFSEAAPRREGSGDYFLYIGRITPEKGVATLVQLWDEIEHPLMVVGDGPQREELAKVAPRNVEFRPTVPGDEVPALIQRSRALMVPSIWYEGAPRSIIEAYASGVPVIASRIGALPEVVQERVSGFLVDPYDLPGWRAALKEIASDEVTRRLGEGAYGIWKRLYSPDVARRELERRYAEALMANA